MKKLAVFVEGQTEQLFLCRLIEEIAGKKSLIITETKIGNLSRFSIQTTAPENVETLFFVLIVNCQSDGRVKSAILEHRPKLLRAGYHLLLGLRDLYPKTLADLPKIKLHLNSGVQTAGLPTHILLAVAEIEAWFIKEHTHFQKIDNRLDSATIAHATGFNPITDNAEEIPHPASLLHDIYAIAGKAYTKKRNNLERTLDALDFAQVYLSLPNHLSFLAILISHLDTFLDPNQNTV